MMSLSELSANQQVLVCADQNKKEAKNKQKVHHIAKEAYNSRGSSARQREEKQLQTIQSKG